MDPADHHAKGGAAATKEGISAQCRALSESLGVTVLIPPEALAAALADESYYHLLLLHRSHPAEFQRLLANPPKAAREAGAPLPSGGELVRSAISAYWQWGQAGFPQVDLKVIERRENACLVCPHFAEPTHPLQKAATLGWSADLIGRRTFGKVCSLCGCSIARKIRLPIAACPAPAPESPGLTRWGEPMAAERDR